MNVLTNRESRRKELQKMKNSVELKQLVDDQYFIDSMNKAFSDLRADYE